MEVKSIEKKRPPRTLFLAGNVVNSSSLSGHRGYYKLTSGNFFVFRPSGAGRHTNLRKLLIFGEPIVLSTLY